MSGRRIYLVASSGYPNYGDELIAASWLRHLAATEPDAEVWLDSPNPGGVELLLGHLHPHLRVTDTLFRLAWAAPSDDTDEVAEFAAEAVRRPGHGIPHRAAGIDLLRSVDVFHVLGGGYINALWPRHVAVLAAGAVLAADHGVRVAATGLGLLPSAASPELLDRLTADYVVMDVRDEGSRALLSGGNVTDTGADAFLGLGDDVVYDKRESPSVMMCFQSDLVDAGVEALATSALETARAWDLRGDKIGYVEAIPGQDRVVFDLISAELPGMRFYPFTEIWREGFPARRGQRWLTTRFHVHLVAAAAGAWGVAFPVRAGYYDVKHESLVTAGSRWALGTPGEVAPATHGEAGFGSALPPLLAGKQELARRVYG